MIQCVPKTWGFAHVCDICGKPGPIVGDFPQMRDETEAKAMNIACPRNGSCLAAMAGWVISKGEDKRDFCPECQNLSNFSGK